MSKDDEAKDVPDTRNYTGKHEARNGREADKSQGRQSGGGHSKGNHSVPGRHGE